MSVNKLTYPAKDNAVQEKINEIIDELGTTTGANIDLSNLSATGESHFGKVKSVNGISPDGTGNVTISTIDGGGVVVDKTIQLRHDDDSDWATTNPTLADGEVGLAYVDDYQSVGIPNYTIEGSPVINKDYIYIASGSESSPKNYIFANKILQFGSYTWKIIAKLNSLESNRTIGAPIFAYNGGTSGDRYDIPYLTFESTSHNRLTLSLSHNGSSWAYDAAGSHEYTGTEYVKLEFDGTKYTVEYSYDSETWNLDNTYTSSSPIYQTSKDYLGIGSYNPDGTQRVYKGELDLKEFKVYINNILEWEAVTFTSEPVRGTKIKIGDGSSTWNNLEYWVTDSYSPTGIQPISGIGIASALASSGFMTEVTSSDIITALGYTPYNSTNPSGYISSIPSSYLQNTATGNNSLSVLGSPASYSGSINIGNSTLVSDTDSVAIGFNSSARSNNSIAIGSFLSVGSGSSYSVALGSGASINNNKSSAIQIGYGTNSTSNSLFVGFYNNSSTHYNWQLLDGTTGLIPDARLSSNIARTSNIPTVDQTYDATSTNAQSGVAVAEAVANKTQVIIRDWS